MPVTLNLNSAKSSQTRLQTDAQNVVAPSVSWFLQSHSVSKVVDGMVTATALKQSLLNLRVIQVQEL